MGWSKSTETRTEIDEVTGLEYPVTENKYVLGVELLGATLAVSGGLFGLSLASAIQPDRINNPAQRHHRLNYETVTQEQVGVGFGLDGRPGYFECGSDQV